MLLNYPELAQILNSSSTQEITRTVIDLRERIEVLHTSEYSEFLQRLYPILHSIITQRTRPQFVDNEENKCRHAILDLLYRFPHNEVLKPVVDNFLSMVMPVFAEDNEENALTALRIVFDLHKFYRPVLESYAQVGGSDESWSDEDTDRIDIGIGLIGCTAWIIASFY
jgi:transformation/transcription domain-associated protein